MSSLVPAAEREHSLYTWPRMAVFFAVILLVGWLLYPNDYFLGLMHSRQFNRDASVEYFREFLERNPHHKGATRALMRTFESAGDPEAAVSAMRELYRHRRGDLLVGTDLLGLLERAGDLEGARAMRWRLFSDLRGRAEIERERLEGLLLAYYEEALLAQDERAERRALETLGNIFAGDDSYRWELLRFHLAKGNWREAVALAEESVRSQGGRRESWEALADAQLASGSAPKALAALSQGLARLPQEKILLERRASILEILGRWREALGDLGRLAALKPQDAASRRRLAHASLKAGLIEEGLSLYRLEVERAPREARGWIDWISALVDAGRAAEAAEALRRYVLAFPDDAWGPELLAFVEERRGRKFSAIGPLRAYVLRHPENEKLMRLLAGLLMESSKGAKR